MDNTTLPDSSSSSTTENSRLRRSWTVTANSDAAESSSLESNLERPKTQGGEVADSPKAGPGGLSKLLSARRRRKERKTSLKQAEEVPPLPNSLVDRASRSNVSRDGNLVASSSSVNDSSNPPEGDAIQLLTDDSEPDRTPPLTTRNSHSGFYTSSSPLIKTTSVDAADMDGVHADVESAVSGPSATGSESNSGQSPSKSSTYPTLDVPAPSNGRRRSVSPGRRLKDAFSSSPDRKSPSNDPDHASVEPEGSRSGRSRFGSNSRRSSLSSKSKKVQAAAEPPPPLPAPIRTDLTEEKPGSLGSSLMPTTPPHTAIPAPQTTVTPPTPTEQRPASSQIMSEGVTDSRESFQSGNSFSSEVTVSPSGNMISHRRVRSASAVHGPSKLSSVTALTPLEEAKTPGSKTGSPNQQGGFFSSVFSAAQNAASSLSNTLNNQQKNRAISQSASADVDNPSTEGDSEKAEKSSVQPGEEKSSAVETLGAGDLNFSHLGIEAPAGEAFPPADSEVSPDKRKNTAVHHRDEEASKLEDKRAARAVHMAYEKPSEPSLVSPPTEDALDVQSTISLPRDGLITGDQTPPSGSILDGDINGGLKRSGSARSRLAQRHRGSSGATASTIGAIGAGAIALGVPGFNSSVPRLTGFAVASKKRNRDFHQLFRSVPEDDYLIEDYSCALQREIILAGRIYISEGHICFSSNILGWVTTLVICFDEIVAIEKENTAMVFPNAIAIQTLHARHTFRSLLSRESTYDLMVNIWKINHPALKSSVNGTRVAHGTGDKTEKVEESDIESVLSDEDEIYDEDEEGDNADSFFEAGDASANASERSLPAKLTRQTSGLLPNGNTTLASGQNSTGDAKNGEKSASPKVADTDFPGPSTHAPTEYTEPNGQYEKVIKDETIPAPLGKVYSLVFGPASGGFMTKFLVNNQKSGELQFEGGSKGLTYESRTRKYSYIKPLNGSIGPKQTKCISIENLDFLDLEKAVLVTLTTQTPDVPSGNVFATKTKYLFTWASGNQTRFIMTCTIEWSGKSWLKGPIEKGAIDGQTAFGNELVKALKMGVVPRGRTNGAGRGKGRRKKGDARAREASSAVSFNAVADVNVAQKASWGFFEPIRSTLEPMVSMLSPLWSGNVAILFIGVVLYMFIFRSPSAPSMLDHDVGCPGYSLPQRLAAYEEMWRREESELWNWLEDRVGMDGMVFPTGQRFPNSHAGQRSPRFSTADQYDLAARLREEKVSDREMDHAIRTTRQRLEILEEMLNKRKTQWVVDEATRSKL